MADENAMENLDNLLIQLALQTRELSVKKDDLQMHIQVCRANIQQKKIYVEENKKRIGKLDEQITEKQRTVQHYKESTKGLKRTHSLLLQYERVLESELERRQENCNRDTKMYQERVESYKAVLKKHREQYHQHPLAQKLLQIQAENEEIERRIRACEDRLAAGASVSTAAPENTEDSVSLGQVELHLADQVEPSVDAKDQFSQGAGCEGQDEAAGFGEERMEEVGSGELDGGRSRAAPAGPSPGTGLMWTSPEARAVQREVAEQVQQGEMEQEDSFNISGIAEEMDKVLEGVAVENQGQGQDQDPPSAPATAAPTGASDVRATGDGAACPPTPPSRMKVVMSTPTFSLSSGSDTLGRRENSEGKSPGFAFSGPLGRHDDPMAKSPGFEFSGPLGRRDDSEGKSPGFEFTGPLGCRDNSDAKSPGFEFTGPLGRRDSSDAKSPGFVFSMTSEPSTPAFSGFGFDMGSTAQGEETPFAFTSEYFSDKKSSESKFSGFPFDQSESRSEEDFQFSFSSKSPAPNAASEDKAGSGEGFPFSFNFGNF
ncbi:uncharacterized protein LOC134078774 isoform X2 [Sardina pilchardus]|uniref:uncharacterized protein LOC134078774 isoform X2 n=1 Tax=Sardina pilchardus TaxID=27697 RepID=UPI002E0F235E